MSPLRRKQNSEQADWLTTLAEIRARPDLGRARQLVTEAAQRVHQRSERASRPAYGWSGGKDSIGLQIVMEAAGIRDSVLVVSALEFPAFTTWIEEHGPAGLTTVTRERLNLAWLKANPAMLFPQTSSAASRWFASTQHAGQRSYCRETGTDLLIMGRRRADGNRVGSREAHGWEYPDPKGFIRYSPIADWSHEDLLNVVISYGFPLPPVYSWPRGFRVGTGPWPARQWTGSQENGWRETLQIDPAVVEGAASADIPGAREILLTS